MQFMKPPKGAVLIPACLLLACSQPVSHSLPPPNLENMPWEQLNDVIIDQNSCRRIDRFLSMFDEHMCFRSRHDNPHALHQIKKVFVEAGWAPSDTDTVDLARKRTPFSNVPNLVTDDDFFSLIYEGPHSCRWHVVVYRDPRLIDREKENTPLFSLNKFNKICEVSPN